MKIIEIIFDRYGNPILKLPTPWHSFKEILCVENIDAIMFCHMGRFNGDS